MANPSDAFWQSVSDAAETQVARMSQYEQQYGESHAYRLANAYMQYPWVNPQLLTSLVLNDADDVLPQVADYAAARMAQAGVTPRDISAEDELGARIQEYMTAKYMETDPSGNALLSEYVTSLRTLED